MSEVEFWTRFFRKTAREQGGSAGSERRGTEKNRLFQSDSRQCILNLYPDTVLSGEDGPMVAHFGIGGGGYGIQKKHHYGTGTARDEDIIDRYNASSAFGIDSNLLGCCHGLSAASDSEPSTGAGDATHRQAVKRRWVDLPDLQASKTPCLVPLGQIAAAIRFGPQADTIGSCLAKDSLAIKIRSETTGISKGHVEGDTGGVNAHLVATRRSELTGWFDSTFNSTFELPEMTAAFPVSLRAARARGAGTGAIASSACRGTSVFDAYRASLNELNERIERSLELLRHFYACFPLNVKGTYERATKLQEVLHHQLEEAKRMVELSRDNPELSAPMQQRVRPLLYLLQSAIEKHTANGTSALVRNLVSGDSSGALCVCR